MKISINLLPPTPEVEILEKKKRTVFLLSALILIVFLFLTLAIFGFYWFLTKNTASTLEAIKGEEAKITSLASQEKLYRALLSKLSYLASLWQEKIKAKELVEFTQALLVPEVTLTKISFNQDVAALSLTASNSEGLENFLNGVVEKEKNGKIKDIKIISTNRNKDGRFDFSLSFKFLNTR